MYVLVNRERGASLGLARPVRAWRSGFADSPRSCNIKTSSPRCFSILLSSFPLTALCPVPRPGFCGHRSAAHRRSLSPLISPAVVLQSPSNRFSLHPARVPLFTSLPGHSGATFGARSSAGRPSLDTPCLYTAVGGVSSNGDVTIPRQMERPRLRDVPG
jgi:hypothetical protein